MFTHDHDDPPPVNTWVDLYWFALHRIAEQAMKNPLVVYYAKLYRLY